MTKTTPYRMNWWQRFTHNILGWPKPLYEAPMYSDTFNLHSTCRYCLKHIMKDSQGNWFHAG